MRKKLLILAVVALFTAPVLLADHYADFYVIPVVGHTPGFNGTMWMSDLAIQNFSSAPLNVELDFVQAGEGNIDNIVPLIAPNQNSSRVTVPAGGSVLLKDVVGNLGSSVLGAILIGADRAFAVTSRSYSMSPSGDTVGQTVPPSRDFLDNTIGVTNNAMATAYVPGLVSNDRFRTNLGFVAGNISGSPMVIEVMVKDAGGTSIGTRQFVVQSGSFTQLQFNSSTVTGNRSFDVAGAEFRIRQGSGAVIPYASIIDNATADAVFVTGQFPANTPFGTSALGTSSFGSAKRSVFRTIFDQRHSF